MTNLNKLLPRPVEEPPRPSVIDRLAARWAALEARLDTITLPRPVEAFEKWTTARTSANAQRRAALSVERAERQRRQKLQAELVEESWFYIDRMLGVTARMSNLSYRYTKTERREVKEVVSTIRFSHVVMMPEALYFRLDTARLPRNVSIMALQDDDTLYNLSMSCGHQVIVEGDPERGFWYIIERSTGVRGIPFHVQLDEIWATRRPSHDGLAIPFGVGENKRIIWNSFNQFQSLLVAGATGAGKSNILNVIICTLIRFNAPWRLKLVLIDLKGGVELANYEELPHLLRYKPLDKKYDPEDDDDMTGDDNARAMQVLEEAGPLIAADDDKPKDEMQVAFVDSPKRVFPLLRALYWEGRRRLALMRRAHCRDVGTYNWKHPKKALPQIVLVFDELAELVQLRKEEESKARTILGQIAGLFRAAGIHVVLATQRPDKTVISGLIKQNCPARLAFNCSDMHASMLIIGTGRAVGLNPHGRAILESAGRENELQTPFMPDRVIADVVAQAMLGHYDDVDIKRHDVGEDEIFRVALEEFAGDLQGKVLFNWFSNHGRLIPEREVYDAIRRYSGREIMIRGVLYQVRKAQGTRPAQLIAVEEEKEAE